MSSLTDQDILSRLSNYEDHYAERKSTGDIKDVLKTAVGFANSIPLGFCGIIYVGVKNDGTIENNANLDSLQRTVSEKLCDSYPPIFYEQRALQRDGRQFLAILVPGSPEGPHFAGQAYIRDGSQTRVASEQQFKNLIAKRNSKARKILEWKGKRVTFRALANRIVVAGTVFFNKGEAAEVTIVDCDPLYVTLAGGNGQDSIPLERVQVSHDHRNNRLRIEA